MPPFLLEKRTTNGLSKISARNSGQYRSEAVERYELNAIEYLLMTVELLGSRCCHKYLKVYNEKIHSQDRNPCWSKSWRRLAHLGDFFQYQQHFQ
jgi:hypothetical protein